MRLPVLEYAAHRGEERLAQFVVINLDDAADALNITLFPDEVHYLDELYTAHEIVGALDKNPTGMLPKDVK